MPGNLVIDTRLDSFERVLERFKDFLTAKRARERALDALLESLATTEAKLRQRIVEIGQPMYVPIGQTRTAQELKAAANTAHNALSDLTDALPHDFEALRAQVQPLRSFCSRMGTLPVAGALKDDLKVKAIELGDDLPKHGAGNCEAWLNYMRGMAKAAPFFSEYVEFLGGLALRDVGFDEGVCDLADDFIRLSYADLNDLVLAIPMRQQAVTDTLAAILRFSFPEWTIWGLPFAAREAWPAVVRKNAVLKAKLDKFPDWAHDAKFKSCLADGFATYTIGPAYAYSALLLHLYPFCHWPDEIEEKVREGHEFDLERATFILATLREMNMRNVWDNLIKDLEDQWTSALGQCTLPAASGAVISGTPVGLNGNENASTTPGVAAQPAPVSETAELAKLLRESLHKSAPTMAFPVHEWERMTQWEAPLRTAAGALPEKRREHLEKIELVGHEDLRWVLNVAWSLRVAQGGKAGAIGDAAAELCELVRGKRQKPAIPGTSQPAWGPH
jgi:hypothetical protein